MDSLTCVRVGYGKVAQLHEQKLSEIGIQTIGVIETDPEHRKQAEHNGFKVIDSYEKAAKLNPFFWDICVNTNQHFNVIKQIISLKPESYLSVEKPVCLASEMQALNQILDTTQIKVVVNENYASSVIVQLVKQIAFEQLKITPTHVIVEFTKNRGLDAAKGRFIDDELGVLGYEGPHMLAILAQLGEDYLTDRIVNAQLIPAAPIAGIHNASKQGSAHLQCTTKTGIPVSLYTSMNGIVRYPYAPFFKGNIPLQNSVSRYRIVAIEGLNSDSIHYRVVGFFEPIAGLARSQGAIALYKQNQLMKVIAPIQDDCMGLHLRRTIQHFLGQAPNPYPVSTALKNTALLNQLAAKATLVNHSRSLEHLLESGQLCSR